MKDTGYISKARKAKMLNDEKLRQEGRDTDPVKTARTITLCGAFLCVAVPFLFGILMIFGAATLMVMM